MKDSQVSDWNRKKWLGSYSELVISRYLKTRHLNSIYSELRTLKGACIGHEIKETSRYQQDRKDLED